MNNQLFEHFDNWKEVKHSDNTTKVQNERSTKMSKTTEQNKRASLVAYVYGQVYRGYLESGKAPTFKITNINVRQWGKALGFMKKNKYIIDFEMGDTIETACDLYVAGFDESNLIYKKYCAGVVKNMLKEQSVA